MIVIVGFPPYAAQFDHRGTRVQRVRPCRFRGPPFVVQARGQPPFNHTETFSMQTDTSAAPPSEAALWTGRVLSTLVILFLLFDASLKLVAPPIVPQTMEELGFSGSLALARGLGVMI